MRKALGILLGVVLISTLFMAPAVADGSCTAKAFKPAVSGGSLTYSGEYACTVTHNAITLTVSLQRRQPGGLWTQISSNTGTEGPTTRNFTGVITGIARDCRKDYRTRANGSASPGGHSGSANSTILAHTC